MFGRLGKILIGSVCTIVFLLWILSSNKSFEERVYNQDDYAQDLSKIYFDLGTKLHELQDLPAAIGAYTSAIEVKHDFLLAHNNLGVCYEQQGDHNAALQVYLKAMSINPSFIEARFSKNFHEISIRAEEYQCRSESVPWTGQDLHKKTIYVFAEKGIGDTLQFCRFLRQLKQRGAHIIFKAQKPLVTLLKNTFPDIECIDQITTTTSLSCDFYVSLLSIPHYLGTTCSTIPDCSGYITVPNERINAMQPIIPHTRKLKIGLVWQGDKNHINDKSRSIKLMQLSPLISTPNSICYSLQKGYGSEQIAHLPKDCTIINLDKHLQDFAATAAAIKLLDVVVSVDTAVAHLASALGKPVFMLVPHITDWRWLGYSLPEKNIWYESMRLYRQQFPGNWDAPVTRIKSDLHAMAINKTKHHKHHAL